MAGLDDFALDISKMIEKSLDFDKEMEDIMVGTAKDIINDIKGSAPVGKSDKHLKDSFVYLKEGSKANKSVTIYSESKGRLAHLIEFGFVHRRAKLVSARPFLRPSYDKEAPKMEEKIIEAIKNGTNKT